MDVLFPHLINIIKLVNVLDEDKAMPPLGTAETTFEVSLYGKVGRQAEDKKRRGGNWDAIA
jgi:hypothetical protein